MKKITLALLFVIGFTVLSCSKSSNHDDVAENTTKTPDETAINTQKIIGTWELVKEIDLDAKHNHLREKIIDNGSCRLPQSYKFSKDGSAVYFGGVKKGEICDNFRYDSSWGIKNSEITFVEKGIKGEEDYTYSYKIETLNDTILQLIEPVKFPINLDGAVSVFIVKHYIRKN